MSLTERARVVLGRQWQAGMRDVKGARLSWWTSAGDPGCATDASVPDLTDEVTVLALAIVCRRRLDAAHGVTNTRREILAYALRDWAFGAITLADLADRVVYVMELIE